MKATTFVFLAIASHASAAVIYDFDSNSYPEETYFREGNTQNIEGWTQNQANPNVDGELPLAYLVAGATGNAGFLNTFVGNNPLTATTTLTGDLAGYSANNRQFSVDLAIFNEGIVRDSFFMTLGTTSNASSLTLYFTPGAVNHWQIGYAINGGSITTTNKIMDTSDDYGYHFDIDFTDAGWNIVYNNGVDPEAFIGSGADTFGSEFTSVVFGLTQTGDSEDWGNSVNGISFDNIAINPVPEPTATLLMGISSLVLLRRRRI